MTAEWRPVVGYEGLYEVSDQGDVRSLDRWVKRGGHMAHISGRVLKPCSDRHGYPVWHLHKDGVARNFRSHVLVAAAFIGPRPEGMDIRHLDGHPGNNAVTNLAYGTRSENMLDALAHGRNRQAAQTQCVNGHDYTAENTIRFGPDRRYRDCRACSIQRKRAYNERIHSARPASEPPNTCRRAGHDWSDPRNVYVRRNGRRHCAECRRQDGRRKNAERAGTDLRAVRRAKRSAS